MGAVASVQIANCVDRPVLCISFEIGDKLQVLLLTLPHFDHTVTTSRVKELRRLVCFQHVYVVVVGCQTAGHFREVGPSQVIQSQVFISGATDQCRPIVEESQRSDYIEVRRLQVLQSIERLQAEGVNVVIAASIKDMPACALEGEYVLGFLTLIQWIVIALSQVINQQPSRLIATFTRSEE